MNTYKADLHIHSVISPCAELEMSPKNIIEEAFKKGLDIIGITDHNCTLHAGLMMELGKEKGIYVIPGVEINTQEEVHGLAFFDSIENTMAFQTFLDSKMVPLPNNSDKLGYQLVVNKEEEILKELPYSLLTGLMADIEEILLQVHVLNGLFIPAHVDRKHYSVFSQIGFIPSNLAIDGIEYSKQMTYESLIEWQPHLARFTCITNSDAHRLEDIGTRFTTFKLASPCFEEIRKALKGIEGREVCR